jgi:hypothetical protein
LAGNRRDHHSRTTAFRQHFRNITTTRWKIDADSHSNEKLPYEEQWKTIGQRAGRGARGDDYHVGEHQLFSAKTICHWTAKSGPKDSAENQACADETDHIGCETKLSDDQRHRHAKNENCKAIKKRAPSREHPKPSLDRFQRQVV